MDYYLQISNLVSLIMHKSMAIKEYHKLKIIKLSITLSINFISENSRHRYPWICSVRSKDPVLQYQHYCAVTLLSRPPGPAVLVGPAHCTYLCKASDGSVLDNCCCAGPNLCNDDVSR